MKKITRRQFLTSAGATSAALLLSSLPHAAAADENCLRKVTPAATNSNGLSFLVEAFKGQRLYGHVTLLRSERSQLAELAASLL